MDQNIMNYLLASLVFSNGYNTKINWDFEREEDYRA